MNILEDTDTINAILADLADRDIVERVAEPIDSPECHPMDWAEVTGLVDELADEIYPEPMVDDNGMMWYVS